MTSQQNLIELAKQGNPKAIENLINRQFQAKGITAKTALKEGCLHIVLESPQILNQQALVPIINKGVVSLGVSCISRVKIYGRRLGEKNPNWSQEVEIKRSTLLENHVNINSSIQPIAENVVKKQDEQTVKDEVKIENRLQEYKEVSQSIVSLSKQIYELGKKTVTNEDNKEAVIKLSTTSFNKVKGTALKLFTTAFNDTKENRNRKKIYILSGSVILVIIGFSLLRPANNMEGIRLIFGQNCTSELELISRTFYDGRVKINKDDEAASEKLSEMRQQIRALQIKNSHLQTIKQQLIEEIDKELLAVVRIFWLEREANWGTTPELTRNIDDATKTVSETIKKETKLIEDGLDYCKKQ